MGWMLAGLKNWEQGVLAEAAAFFSAVADAKLPADATWMIVYQDLAGDYLADHQVLTSAVFEKLPEDPAACKAAVDLLDAALLTLKTRGRARFNVRAWQLDLTRHAKLLEISEIESNEQSPPELAAVMARLTADAGECRFLQAADFLKSLSRDPAGAKRDSLLALAESSAVFLSDIEEDLAKGAVAAELLMKSGEVMREISIDASGAVVTKDAGGNILPHPWRDFSPDALIALHRILVKTPKSELERLRRHQCAIAFDWLAGNRERSLSAAALLVQSSPSFKQQWEPIAAGLPE
jgi:hypothetical protein